MVTIVNNVGKGREGKRRRIRLMRDSGIVAGGLTAILLNAVFHFGKARKSAALPLQEQKIS
ncbi:hypothetical protein [Geobacillus sp. DSP4a]|uniref:hypothetical protein n=1 Tax=Geobacillus sp. DSP4a TaxID=2508873 RepID=UPI001F16A56E|nr:hypothetical protein [Geobacillus sp. DSP4a]